MATSNKARTPCQACGKDRGTVYVPYEGRRLCLECAEVWEFKREEAQQHEHKREH